MTDDRDFWMYPLPRAARYGLTSWAAHLAHGLLDLLPWPLRPALWKLLLGRMGRSVVLDYGVFIRVPWFVKLGSDLYIGRGSQLWAHSHEAGITIGNHVLIAPGALLTTLSHDYRAPGMPVEARPITVGDQVWIGARAVILPGVSLGTGAVVAAGAVVNADVPAWTVVAGVPARVVKRREPGEPLNLEELPSAGAV